MIDDIASIAQCCVKSIKANTFINTNIEMMKLTMNSKKCKKIHIGKSNCMCPDLKVHGDRIEETDKEKYLGDQISGDCNNNTVNISMRKGKGIGIVSQIMLLLDEMCLGQYYFETAKRLRESSLVNGILFNSEVWYDLQENDIRGFTTNFNFIKFH